MEEGFVGDPLRPFQDTGSVAACFDVSKQVRYIIKFNAHTTVGCDVHRLMLTGLSQRSFKPLDYLTADQ